MTVCLNVADYLPIKIKSDACLTYNDRLGLIIGSLDVDASCH
jgi:hypothetical protein